MTRPTFPRESRSTCHARHQLTCSECAGENDRPTQPHCKKCHAANMKTWRAKKKTEQEEMRAELERLRLAVGEVA